VTPPTGASGAAGSGSSSAAETSKWGDALSFEVKKLWDSPTNDRVPQPSPDGKSIAFLRAEWELVIRDEASGAERVLIKHFDSMDYRWSPDSRYMAYATEDRNNNSDIFVVPVDGSAKPVNITRHPNFDSSPRWSADGRILAFLSNRTGVGDETAAYTVMLDKETEQLSGPELEAYYREAGTAARRRTPPTTRPSTQPSTRQATQPSTQAATRRGASTQPVLVLKREDLEDAYLRVRRASNVRGGVSNLEIAPSGDRLYFVGSLGSQRGLLSQSREAPEPTRIAAAGDVQAISLTGDSITMVESSRAAVVKLPSGETEYYDPSFRLTVDLAAMSRQKFLEAARIMQWSFYNPKMNGVDWQANTAHYLPLALAARTSDEFEFVANRYIGELNASHLGIDAPSSSSPLAQSVGRLGADTERVEGGFKVKSVTTDGPSDRGAMKLKAGDVITALDFEPIAPSDTLEKRLTGKSGTEVVVSVKRDGKDLDLLITPTSAEALSSLAYNQWRLKKLEEVEKLSGGRLGYIHIQGMNQSSLETYKRDLFAALEGKEGLLIDVRWNGGGSTADLLLASIMSPYHAYTQMRGGPEVKDSYPVDRLFIPRFTGPINMLCNERSFSNAEIISHAFKTLKRGTLVGNQTAGGVISTGGASLLDGTSVRTPGRGWFTPDGTNMELNGAMPDIVIVQTPDDEVSGEDRQLKAAVEDLMKRLPKK
jgi:tricorn protease